MSEYEWLNTFADNLVSLLEDTGMTQRELAKETGLTEGSISSYINKRKLPGIKAIINIAYVLNVDISELIDFDEMIM